MNINKTGIWIVIFTALAILNLEGCVTKSRYVTEVTAKEALANQLQQEQERSSNLEAGLQDVNARLEATLSQTADTEEELTKRLREVETGLEETRMTASQTERELKGEIAQLKALLEETQQTASRREEALLAAMSEKEAQGKRELEEARRASKAFIEGLQEELVKGSSADFEAALAIEYLEKDLAKKDLAVSELQQRLSARTEELERLERDLQLANEAREEVTKKEEEARRVQQALIEEREVDLTKLEETLRAQQALIEDLEVSLAKKDLEVSELWQRLAVQTQELERGQKALRVSEEFLSDKERKLQERIQAHKDLIHKLQNEIDEGHITVSQLKGRLSVQIIDKLLFASGSDQVTSEGQNVLKRVGDILKDIEENNIRIEGHTDNVPIGPKIIDKFATNWELSTARATQVVRYLAKQEVDPGKMEAVGMSKHRPVTSNETAEGRQQNRRIEIILYPRDIEEIVSSLP